ncbi:MAG: ABC transporter permease [Chloroflexota bacterium]|nr:ABC transporter permease [Chloroflexota bacterium]
MGRYVLHRLSVSLPLLLVISIIAFTFINIAPGSPIDAMINPSLGLTGEQEQHLREELGLNKPLPVRYLLWLGQAIQGNLGYSYNSHTPVLSRIGERLGPTLELMGAALLASTLVGMLFGVICAIKAYSAWDYLLGAVSLLGFSVPSFFVALIALYVFAARLQILPAFGMSTGANATSLGDNLYHLVLPASVLSVELMATLTRYTRSAMLEVLHADYVTTARSKGLANLTVITRHAFRNALLPLITVVSLRLPVLVGGAIVVEAVFQWPGMGQLSVQAIQQRDYPVLMGLTIMISLIVLLANLLADVLYAYADPRIRV